MKKSGTKIVLVGIVTLCSILLITGPALARTEFLTGLNRDCHIFSGRDSR